MGLFKWKKSKKEERDKKKIDAASVKVGGDKKNIGGKRTVSESTGDKKSAGNKKKSMKELYGAKEVAVTAKGGKKVKKERKYGNAYRILIRPLITEKAANLGAENKYVFTVASRANKIEVAKAIDELYGVKPSSVNMIKMRGKKVRYGRITGRRKNWKKAVITLPEGKSINIYEGV